MKLMDFYLNYFFIEKCLINYFSFLSFLQMALHEKYWKINFTIASRTYVHSKLNYFGPPFFTNRPP